jgi:hypothetical protein
MTQTDVQNFLKHMLSRGRKMQKMKGGSYIFYYSRKKWSKL